MKSFASFAVAPGDDTNVGGVQNAAGTRRIMTEYDGLESGEIAWIYGRQHMNDRGIIAGYGPDRMQRLAYTGFVEAMFVHDYKMKNLVVDLTAVQLTGAGDANAATFGSIVAGSSVVNGIDVAYVSRQTFAQLGTPANTLPGLPPAKRVDAEEVPGAHGIASAGLNSGLFVLESGPFLRGMMQDAQPVDIPDPTAPSTVYTVERNLGDVMAFSALYAKLKDQQVFDWSPDGIVLSKLESPSGEPLSSAELDARQAQLFNIAIQGPTIAKTWTGNPQLQCMPLDKVFVLLVAKVTTVLDNQNIGGVTNTVLADTVQALQQDQRLDQKTYREKLEALSKAFTEDATESSTFAKLVKTSGSTLTKAQAEEWDAAAVSLLNRKAVVTKCTMSEFRLKRATSSYLVAHSHSTRCGLGIKMQDNMYAAEYIIGGWCIGTVLDNAASRSTVGHQVRVSPASMALNVNVNVEWWSGDKLHRHFMDVDGLTQQRGFIPKDQIDTNNANNAEVVSWG